MQVSIRYTVYDVRGRHRLKTFTANPVAMCCERMTDEWGGIVDVNLFGFPTATNLHPMILTAAYPLADSDVVSAATPISHCPWCGSLIELVDGGIEPSANVPDPLKLVTDEGEGLAF